MPMQQAYGVTITVSTLNNETKTFKLGVSHLPKVGDIVKFEGIDFKKRVNKIKEILNKDILLARVVKVELNYVVRNDFAMMNPVIYLDEIEEIN